MLKAKLDLTKSPLIHITPIPRYFIYHFAGIFPCSKGTDRYSMYVYKSLVGVKTLRPTNASIVHYRTVS